MRNVWEPRLGASRDVHMYTQKTPSEHKQLRQQKTVQICKQNNPCHSLPATLSPKHIPPHHYTLRLLISNKSFLFCPRGGAGEGGRLYLELARQISFVDFLPKNRFQFLFIKETQFIFHTERESYRNDQE